jgi:hypothetical protein
VILSGIVLVFAFIATIGSTYAWFTVSSSTEVSEMTLNVRAEDNMLINVVPYDYLTDTFTPNYSLDPADYLTGVTPADLYAAGYLYDTHDGTSGTGPWQLLPSTVYATTTLTHDTINAKALSYISNLASDDRTLSVAEKNNSTDGRYIQLQFVLLSQSSEPQAIELSGMSILASGNDASTQDAVEYATRVSIWMDDTGFSGTYPDGYTPNEGNELIFGRDTDFAFSFLGSGTGYDRTGFNTLADLSAAASPSVIDIYDDVTTNDFIVPTNDIFVLQSLVPTLVVVNIFVEGWDEQADNFLIGAGFDISFGFQFGTQD